VNPTSRSRIRERTFLARAARAGGLACALLTIAFGAPGSAAPTATSRLAGFDVDAFAEILRAHTRAVDDVAGTRVDYAALRESEALRRVVASLERARPSSLAGDRAATLAFWINAYNVLAIDLVAKHWPVGSIRDLGSFFSPVWDREVVTIEGRALSLGAIEHEILRPIGDPRIHAAIVCASTSCPSLAREPYRADTIDAQLSAAMRRFLEDSRKGLAIDRDALEVRTSKIFSWFEDDFASAGGPLLAIADSLGGEAGDWLRTNARRVDVDHFDYDWTVNALR